MTQENTYAADIAIDNIEIVDDIATEESTLLSTDSTDNSLIQETLKDETLKQDVPTIDFANLSTDEIIEQAKKLLETHTLTALKTTMDNLPSIFNDVYKSEYETALSSFMANGGVLEDFKYTSDAKIRFQAIYRGYKTQKANAFKRLEEERAKNLEIKLALVEELKKLADTEETLGVTFQELRKIQDTWKNTGPVPQANVNDLLETYHLYLENFYKGVKIDKALRDYDLKHNFDEKTAICQEAKKLSESEDAATAFKMLQSLHNQWKEIGPVPLDKKDELWDEFKSYSSIINEKNQIYFDAIRTEQAENLKTKEELCLKVETILQQTYSTVSEWENNSTIIIACQEDWKHSGTVSLKDRNTIYKRFRAACDTFFEKKREFYKSFHSIQEANLELKIALCEKVEALKDSTDWKITTDKIIACQKEWKTLGAAPRKHSDKVWKRFRTACDTFFSNKNAHFSDVDKEYIENLDKKKALIEDVKSYVLTGDNNTDVTALKEFQKTWNTIGFVPIKAKATLQDEFRHIMNKWFEKLNIDENERELERFKSKITSLETASNNAFKIVSEREKLVTKIRLLETDINTWENNIGFISKSNKSKGLISELESKIEKTKQKLVLAKNKLTALDNII